MASKENDTMAELRYGVVTYKGRPMGTLREEPGGGSSFEYDPGVALPIACALPLETGRTTHPHGLIPVFAHLGPEGWLRDRQTAYADVDANDDFGILLAFGRDCIGAIGIEDPQNHSLQVGLKPLASTLDAAAVGERTISGVQAKILCAGDLDQPRPARADEAAPLIAKYPQHDLPDMIFNEAVTLELCRLLLGVDEVCQSKIGIVDQVEGVALIVDRFDRHGAEKLRCEDFMQVLNRPPGLGHQGKYDADYADIERALRHSAAPQIDARRVFLRLAVYVLLGNVDCHMKNWSLLEAPGGLRLSPVYDVVNGYIYGAKGYTTRFGLNINGVRRQWEDYDRALLLSLAEPLGLPPPAAEAALTALKRRKKRLAQRLSQSLRLSEDASYLYRMTVNQAWERLYGEPLYG